METTTSTPPPFVRVHSSSVESWDLEKYDTLSCESGQSLRFLICETLDDKMLNSWNIAFHVNILIGPRMLKKVWSGLHKNLVPRSCRTSWKNQQTCRRPHSRYIQILQAFGILRFPKIWIQFLTTWNIECNKKSMKETSGRHSAKCLFLGVNCIHVWTRVHAINVDFCRGLDCCSHSNISQLCKAGSMEAMY